MKYNTTISKAPNANPCQKFDLIKINTSIQTTPDIAYH